MALQSIPEYTKVLYDQMQAGGIQTDLLAMGKLISLDCLFLNF